MPQTRYQNALDDATPLPLGSLATVESRNIISATADGDNATQLTASVGTISSSGDTVALEFSDGTVISIEASSTTQSTAATDLAAAINADPVLYARLTAEASTTDVVITGRYTGQAISATSVGDTTVTVTEDTAASAPTVIPYGAVVVPTAGGSDHIRCEIVSDGVADGDELGIHVRPPGSMVEPDPRDTLSIADQGTVVVKTDGSDITPGDDVYITDADGVTFSNSSGSGKTQLSSCTFRRQLSTNRAQVRINK